MRLFAASLRKFLTTEDGPTAVEYAVMLALIIALCLTAIGAIGTNLRNSYQGVSRSLASSS